jgi:hypothetical protein
MSGQEHYQYDSSDEQRKLSEGAADGQPPAINITLNTGSKRHNSFLNRHKGEVALGTVVVAGAAAVYIYAGKVWDNFTEPFATEVNVEQEADAALGNVELPNDTRLVKAEGSSFARTTADISCPRIISWVCGQVPYMEAETNMTASFSTFATPNAIQFDAKVDSEGNPYVEAIVDSSQLTGELGNQDFVTENNEYLIADVADLLTIETGIDELATASETSAESALQDGCSEDIERALPAAIANTVKHELTDEASQLVREKNTDAANYLEAMSAEPVRIRFEGTLDIGSANPIQNGEHEIGGMNLTVEGPDHCDIGTEANQQLNDYEAGEGTTYVVVKPLESAA